MADELARPPSLPLSASSSFPPGSLTANPQSVPPPPATDRADRISTASPTEYCVLWMGTHKQSLFHRLQSLADKFEPHIQYDDTCYLTFHLAGTKSEEAAADEIVVLELIDPGIEHTGAREMAIRKADAAILCYAAYSPASYHTLCNIAEDFKCLEQGKQPCSLLLCNEDQLFETSEEDKHIGDKQQMENSPSESEKEQQRNDVDENHHQHEQQQHSSSPSPQLHSPRRPSLEQIRMARDEGNCPISREQGEQLAQQFGPYCEFRCLPFSSIDEGSNVFLQQLVHQLIQRAKDRRQNGGSRQQSSNNNNGNNNHRVRSRSQGNSSSARRSRLSSPIIPKILKKTASLKKLLLKHTKNEEKQQQQANGAAAAATNGSESPNRLNGQNGATTTAEQQQQQPKQKQQWQFGNAFRVLVHPKERRAQSQNKVASTRTIVNGGIGAAAEDAAGGGSKILGSSSTNSDQQPPIDNNNSSQKASIASSYQQQEQNIIAVPSLDLSVTPATGEPSNEPFNFADPIKVNNFVNEDSSNSNGQQEEQQQHFEGEGNRKESGTDDVKKDDEQQEATTGEEQVQQQSNAENGLDGQEGKQEEEKQQQKVAKSSGNKMVKTFRDGASRLKAAISNSSGNNGSGNGANPPTSTACTIQ